ncbi:phospholipase C/P1 nuclease domain-containing protein [Dactylonectria estremocensis]|uniref:Phospholipase C/P1 nuclease domain-containing protein n=1 Tax=Dactylonectria estremocensis TaxID=1079267 RepID=A0A9P9FBS2_9HYPO|nr:phospholipase C/P1 nuclease domain-containing protein [Dactylonectria estremocensis]
MKLLSTTALAMGAIGLPGAAAWGSLGHMTTAYLASQLVSNTTEVFFQELLGSNSSDYLAAVAPWADSIRYTDWGRFSKNFHFIDAHDSPPTDCSVDYERDCKDGGCVINALANYTKQSLDPELPRWQREQAAKFVIHFIGDMHQPLHNENTALGGNRIYVHFDGQRFNLHHVWDSSIMEKFLGGLHGAPLAIAEKWSATLAIAISDGKFAAEKESWLKDLNLDDPINSALAWSRETNALVCKYVFPEGPHAIEGKELGGEYAEKAGPVIEKQVARAGYRMAAWLDRIVDAYQAENKISEEL